METTQILLIAGAIGLAVLAIIAIRGSFKDDDSFYGGSTTVAGSNAADNGPGHDANDGGGNAGGDGTSGGGDGGGGGGSGGDGGSGGASS